MIGSRTIQVGALTTASRYHAATASPTLTMPRPGGLPADPPAPGVLPEASARPASAAISSYGASRDGASLAPRPPGGPGERERPGVAQPERRPIMGWRT